MINMPTLASATLRAIATLALKMVMPRGITTSRTTSGATKNFTEPAE